MGTEPQRSAGLVLYRCRGDRLEILIGHPGGPFWRNKHEGAWSIPKGLVEPGEDERVTALREFAEETGCGVKPDEMLDLGEVVLRSGKAVTAWAVRGDFDPATLRSNPVRLEWPRGSGKWIEFPEIDEVRWCDRDAAERLLNPHQIPFIIRLQELLDHAP